MTAHELLAHDEAEDAVTEELEPLVGRVAARRPRAVSEDLTTPARLETPDEPGEPRAGVGGDAQPVCAIT
jgi:hypothetical protein